jgi:hypothetical protein
MIVRLSETVTLLKKLYYEFFITSVSIAMQEDLHLPLEEESNVTRAQLVYVAQIFLTSTYRCFDAPALMN